MTILTPGIIYLGRLLFFLVLPALLAFLAKTTLEHHDMQFPSWYYVLFSVFAWPGVIAFQALRREIVQRREAHRMGARLAPRVRGKWLGNLDVVRITQRAVRRGYPGDIFDDLVSIHGPTYNMNVLWDDMILTIQPEHIQKILATDFQNYVKGERFQKNMSAMLGIGVFNADGDMWKFHRQMTRPFFTKDRISHFELFDRHVEKVITQMKERMRSGYPVDFQEVMARFTLDSATEFLFGSCVNSLSATLPYPHYVTSASTHAEPQSAETRRAQEFAKAFLDVQDAVSTRERLGPLWPLNEIFEDRAEAPMKIVNGLVEPIIAEAVAKKKAAGLGEEKGKKDEIDEDETLLDHLVQITDDPVVLKDATLNILLAGRDTTSATLTFIMYFLSTHPHVTARLREEVLTKVGPTRRPTYDDVKEMKYLRAVINETLRLYPVVPFNVREAVHSTTWPSPDPTQKPIYIPAGAKTPYSVFMMHRRTDLWGPDAEEFDPDRFLDDRLKKYLSPRPFIFLPFNAGPRICLGQQFAYNEMSFTLVRLLQSFRSFAFEPSATDPEFQTPKEWEQEKGRKGQDKFWPKMTLTMYSGGGLWIRSQEAEV